MSFVLDTEEWTTSTPSAESMRMHGSLQNQSTCVLWKGNSTMSLEDSCRGIIGIMGCQAPSCELFASCMTRVRLWSTLPAVSKTTGRPVVTNSVDNFYGQNF